MFRFVIGEALGHIGRYRDSFAVTLWRSKRTCLAVGFAADEGNLDGAAGAGFDCETTLGGAATMRASNAISKTEERDVKVFIGTLG